MKKILLVIMIVVLLAGCSTEEDKVDIDEMINNMTLDEKIGQMMIIYYKKGEVDSTLKSSLYNVKPGGFILFGENMTSYEKSLEMIKTIKSSNKIPMFISIDEEGGRVQRLRDLKDRDMLYIPSMYHVGLMDDVDLTEKVGKVIGEELRVFGINMDFAPVIDIFENEENTVIGKRSFGTTPEFVSKHGIALAKGLESTGVIPVYKHFPGHGNTSTDSHVDLPIVTKSKEELLNDDLIPFKKVIDSGAEVIMVGHLAVPSVTGDNTPASLSKEVITDLLKGELGYKGLVITDALDMGALSKNYTNEEIYVKAINAGVDILLMPPSSKEALTLIKENVLNGNISEERINESVRKILTLKYNKIDKDYNNYLDSSYLGSKEHKEIIDKIPVTE